jgi:hypothetical protein
MQAGAALRYTPFLNSDMINDVLAKLEADVAALLAANRS